jgi:hypothetical protein
LRKKPENQAIFVPPLSGWSIKAKSSAKNGRAKNREVVDRKIFPARKISVLLEVDATGI